VQRGQAGSHDDKLALLDLLPLHSHGRQSTWWGAVNNLRSRCSGIGGVQKPAQDW
jgi:hypothetical protein